MYLNRAQIIGRLTQDPELKQTPSGQSVVSFSLATNRKWKDNNSGEMKEQAEFHSIVAWGKLAEIIGNYLKKGRQVFIEGRLQTRSWEDGNSVKHWKTEIIAENMIMLDGKGNSTGESNDFSPEIPTQDEMEEEVKPASKSKKNQDINIEDVPF